MMQREQFMLLQIIIWWFFSCEGRRVGKWGAVGVPPILDKIWKKYLSTVLVTINFAEIYLQDFAQAEFSGQKVLQTGKTLVAKMMSSINVYVGTELWNANYLNKSSSEFDI